jgi:hypothetical protein
MRLSKVAKVLFVLVTAAFCTQFMMAEDVMHAVEGAVTKIDVSAKTIAIKAADGTEHVFKYTEKTTVRGVKAGAHEAKTGAVEAYMKGKEGTDVVVHYTGEGAEKSAVAIRDMGKDTVKVAHGTVTKVDKAGHTVTVKTEDGSEETYHLAKDATVEGEHGIMKGADYAKEGEKVSVHYTEDAGKKVAHFLRHL